MGLEVVIDKFHQNMEEIIKIVTRSNLLEEPNEGKNKEIADTECEMNLKNNQAFNEEWNTKSENTRVSKNISRDQVKVAVAAATSVLSSGGDVATAEIAASSVLSKVLNQTQVNQQKKKIATIAATAAVSLIHSGACKETSFEIIETILTSEGLLKKGSREKQTTNQNNTFHTNALVGKNNLALIQEERDEVEKLCASSKRDDLSEKVNEAKSGKSNKSNLHVLFNGENCNLNVSFSGENNAMENNMEENTKTVASSNVVMKQNKEKDKAIEPETIANHMELQKNLKNNQVSKDEWDAKSENTIFSSNFPPDKVKVAVAAATSVLNSGGDVTTAETVTTSILSNELGTMQVNEQKKRIVTTAATAAVSLIHSGACEETAIKIIETVLSSEKLLDVKESRKGQLKNLSEIDVLLE